MPQSWNAADYQSKGSFVPTLGEPLLDFLGVTPGMRVLDLGCGDGTLTLKLIERGANVVGVDASPDMITAAKAKGIDARLCDAHALGFQNEFDAVFSNAALHWMTDDHAKVLQNIYSALKPGGIFVGEMGGKGNIAEIQRCLQEMLRPVGLDLNKLSPKFFPDEAGYQALLEIQGFRVDSINRFERPTPLPDGVSGWLRVFDRRTLEALPEGSIDNFVEQVEACTRERLYNPECGWFADYVRLRFVAHKP